MVGVLVEFANSWCFTSQTHCWCYDVSCMYTWLPVAVPFLASWCFRLCEDPKQCSSILIWVLLGFDMLVLFIVCDCTFRFLLIKHNIYDLFALTAVCWMWVVHFRSVVLFLSRFLFLLRNLYLDTYAKLIVAYADLISAYT